jgi:hypothetical protein
MRCILRNDEGQAFLFVSISLSIANIDIQELVLGRINLLWGRNKPALASLTRRSTRRRTYRS